MIIHKKEHPYMPRNGYVPRQFTLPDKRFIVIKHRSKTGEHRTTTIDLKSIAEKYGIPLHVVVNAPFNISEHKSLPEQLDVDAQNWQIKLEFDCGTIGAARVEIINIVPVKPFSELHTQLQPQVSADELRIFLGDN